MNYLDVYGIFYIEAVNKYKELLTSYPVLIYPDFNKPFLLTTDASVVSIGAVLSQGEVNSDRPVAYASTRVVSKVSYTIFLYPRGRQETSGIRRELSSGCGGSTVKFLSGRHDPFVSCNQATMELPLTPTADCEICSVIRFLTAKN